MLKRSPASKEVWIPRWWNTWVPTWELVSTTLLVTAWSKRRTTMCMLRPRPVRELLSQVRPSLGPRWQIVPRIVLLPLVQGLGHPSGRVRMPSNLRGTRNHSRWRCHKRRQDKAVHLELWFK
jgi:hypothetical protein